MMKLGKRTFLVLCVLSAVDCTIISNVNSIFEVFSPKSMVRFFEFNDFGWNITGECVKDMYNYLDALQREALWAYKLLDASGNYFGGYFNGNNLRPIDPMQCMQLNVEINELTANINETKLPFYVQMITVKYRLNQNSFDRREVHQSVCMPKNCNFYDLSQVMSYYNINPENKIINEGELIEIRILKEEYNYYDDFNFLIVITITFVMIFFILSVTIYEYMYNVNANDLTIGLKNIQNNGHEHGNRQIVKCLTPPRNSHGAKIYHQKTRLEQKPSGSFHQKVKVNNNELTNVRMDSLAESLTINNFSTHNHVNMVKVKKMKAENTISLDIISANCYNAFALQKKQAMLAQKNKVGEFRESLFKFSLQHQFKKSVSRETVTNYIDEINAIHGVRAICLFWILLVHTTTFLSYVAYNKKYIENVENNLFLFLILRNASFSVDSYFFISGILLCHSFYNSTRDLNIHKLKNVFDQFLHFFGLNIFKILRLILPYVMILHVLSIAMKHFKEYSVLDIPSNDHVTCEANMWKNLLFIDNFVPYAERCMIWTWYISLEVQFFVVSSLLLMLSRSYPRYAAVIFLSFFAASFMSTTMLNMGKSSDLSNLTVEQKLIHFNGVYEQPLVLFGPYVIGIIFGNFICRNNRKIVLNNIFYGFGWLTCIIVFILMTFGPFFIKESNPWLKSGLLTIGHCLWALILVWITCFGTFFKNLFSLKIFYILSQITNCVLLVHPLVTRIFILGSNQGLFLSVQMIIIIFFGIATISCIIGFVLYLLFESPIIILLNIIYERSIKS